jgi:ribonuclease HI
MSFDGTCYSFESGVRIVFKYLNKSTHFYDIKLEFPCTNNEAKYEALIQGIILDLKMEIEHLFITGDFELDINHVTKKYKIKKERIKLCAKRVNELMNSFSSFNLSFIPRERNQKDESLVVATSLFILDEFQNKNTFQVKRISRPSISDNQEYIQVFENDEELNEFFSNLGEFEESIQSIPKKCIKSKSLFSQDDQTKKLKEEEYV